MTRQNAQMLDRALAHQRRGETDAADAIYRHILTVNPGNAEAMRLSAAIAHHAKDYARALDLFARAIAARPDFADAYYGRGLLRLEIKERDAANDDFRQAIAHDPNHSGAHIRLGLRQLEDNDLDSAASSLERALTADPGSATAAINLGLVRRRQGRLDDALHYYEQACKLAPDMEVAHGNLATVLQELGRSDEAIAILRRFDIDTADPVIATNLLTSSNLVPGDLATALIQARRWAARFADKLAGPPARRRVDPERRLRLGYIGTDQLRRHTLAMTYLPLFGAHNRELFDVIAYSDQLPSNEDGISKRFRAVATWRETAELDDAALAELIQADEIDILIDAVGFARGSRLLTMARRPAPIQVQFPVMSTTGMAAMDYAIGDTRLLPPGVDAFFAERLWRLPYGYLYVPLIELPPLVVPPFQRNGYLTFGSFNRITKFGADTVTTWAAVLRAVPRSRLIIKGIGISPVSVERYRQQFQAAGVEPGRLEFRGQVASDAAHFAQYNDVDIAFDTFPHCGVVTTFDALAMGVPVVTLAGTRPLERYGAAILGALDLNFLVADSQADYVAKAASLAADPDRLTPLRQGLRAHLAASPLGNPAAFAPLIEDAYREMWRRWCQSATSRGR
jgi:predicted O-linked N-acetylglucosamine transferase (SPINDLY family)